MEITWVFWGQEISVLHGAEKGVSVAKEISAYLLTMSIFHAANRKRHSGNFKNLDYT